MRNIYEPNFFSAVEQKINVNVEDMKIKNILKYRPSPEGEG